MVARRLESRRIGLRVTADARELIAREGYDPVYGARPLRRFIQREVETRIGRALLAGDVPDGRDDHGRHITRRADRRHRAGPRVTRRTRAGDSVMAAKPTTRCPNCGTLNRIASQAEGVPRCGKCKEPLPWVVDATRDTFAAELRASVPVLVDFWAPWCGPCRMVSPAVAAVAEDLAGKLKVVKLDIDTAPAIADEHGVQGIPLLVLFRDGGEGRAPGRRGSRLLSCANGFDSALVAATARA